MQAVRVLGFSFVCWLGALFGALPPAAAADLSTANAVEAQFQSALTLMSRGQAVAAAPLLKEILAGNPGLVRVRLELARALFLAGDLAASKRQFLVALSADGVPIEVKNTILDFIRKIDSNQGFSRSLSFKLTSLAESGRSYDTDIVQLDLFGAGPLPFVLNRPDTPALGFEVEGSLRRQWHLGNLSSGAQSFVFLGGTGRILDAPGSAYDELQVTVSPGLRLVWPRTTLSIEQRSSAQRTGTELSKTEYGFASKLQTRTAAGTTYFADLAVSWDKNYLTPAATGWRSVATIGVQRALNANGSVTVSATVEGLEADRADYGYLSGTLRAARQLDLQWGLSVEASLHLTYFWQSQASPGFQGRRNEREYGINLTAEKTDILLFNRYSPYISIGAAKRESTISAFSYHSLGVQLGLRSAF